MPTWFPPCAPAPSDLRHGRILILYPEGERSIDGTPRTFKKGAAILSIHLQVPIVPVAIEGFYDAWPRGKPFQKFAPLKIQFGDPIYPPPEAEASEAAYEKLTAELKSRVVGMWEGLRGRRKQTASADATHPSGSPALYCAAAWAFCPKAFMKASTIIESYSACGFFRDLFNHLGGTVLLPAPSPCIRDSNFSARFRICTSINANAGLAPVDRNCWAATRIGIARRSDPPMSCA